MRVGKHQQQDALISIKKNYVILPKLHGIPKTDMIVYNNFFDGQT